MWRTRGRIGLKEHRAARSGLKNESGIMSERHVASTLNPAFVDRDSSSVITDARGEITLTGKSSDNEADDPEAVGGQGVLTKAVAIVAVVIEGTGSEREKNEGNQ